MTWDGDGDGCGGRIPRVIRLVAAGVGPDLRPPFRQGLGASTGRGAELGGAGIDVPPGFFERHTPLWRHSPAVAVRTGSQAQSRRGGPVAAAADGKGGRGAPGHARLHGGVVRVAGRPDDGGLHRKARPCAVSGRTERNCGCGMGSAVRGPGFGPGVGLRTSGGAPARPGMDGAGFGQRWHGVGTSPTRHVQGRR